MAVSRIPSACRSAPAGERHKIERSDFVLEAGAAVTLVASIGRF